LNLTFHLQQMARLRIRVALPPSSYPPLCHGVRLSFRSSRLCRMAERSLNYEWQSTRNWKDTAHT
jgi:hypothetical protein